MTTKEAVPQVLPLPQNISPDEMDNRALHLAALSLIERLSATENDVQEAGVAALINHLQELMRVFNTTTFECDVSDGTVTFKRTIINGDWLTGRWNLAWSVSGDPGEHE